MFTKKTYFYDELDLCIQESYADEDKVMFYNSFYEPSTSSLSKAQVIKLRDALNDILREKYNR